MKSDRNKKGQFIIIAALMVSILVISVSAIMYGTVTYFRHERWEEYLSLVDTLKIGSRRVVEISLANYTLGMNSDALKDNLNKWKINVTRAYSGFGIVLNPELDDDSYLVYDLNISYSLGLSSSWYGNVSYSAANVTLQMNITSIGLTGYKFMSTPLVKEEILSAVYDTSESSLTIKLSLDKEDTIPLTNLRRNSFSLSVKNTSSGQWQSKNFSMNRLYDSESFDRFIYVLYSDNFTSQPSDVSVVAVETRNIKVVANSTVTTQA